MPNDVDLTFSVGDTTQWSIISIEQHNQNWWHQVYVVCCVTPSYLLQSTLEYKCLRNLYSSCRPKHIKSYVEFYTSSSKSCLSFWVNPTKPNKWFGKAFLSMLLQLLGHLLAKRHIGQQFMMMCLASTTTHEGMNFSSIETTLELEYQNA